MTWWNFQMLVKNKKIKVFSTGLSALCLFNLGSRGIRRVTFPKIQYMCGGTRTGIGLPTLTVLCAQGFPTDMSQIILCGASKALQGFVQHLWPPSTWCQQHLTQVGQPKLSQDIVQCPLGAELHYPACQAASNYAATCLAFSTCSLPHIWRTPPRGTSFRRPSLPAMYPSAQISQAPPSTPVLTGQWGVGSTREEWRFWRPPRALFPSLCNCGWFTGHS